MFLESIDKVKSHRTSERNMIATPKDTDLGLCNTKNFGQASHSEDSDSPEYTHDQQLDI